MNCRDFLALTACVGIGVAGTKLATTRQPAAGRFRQSVVPGCFERGAQWKNLADAICTVS
jgi:hypothetical protein